MDFKSLFNQYLEAITRFVPRPQQPSVLGIDIGTSTVRAVEIGRPAAGGAGAGFEMRLWAVEPIQGGDVKAALSQLIKKIRYTDQTLVTSVSGKGTLIRYIDMPRMPLEDLRRSFTYDLDKYFPFDPKSIYTDCFILDPSNAEKRMSVLVVAVKKEIVDERLKLFKDLGLKLEHITTDTVAVANAFARLGPHPADGGAKAILDIGEDVSDLIILKDLSPRFTRDIFVGGREMTKQIAHVLGVDESKAEAMKKAPGERPEAMLAACEGPIANLVDEIRLSLDYFMTEKNIQVGEFFLLGGGSLLKGIEGVFERNLGIRVKIWDPVADLRLSPSVASSDIRLSSSQLGVAIGLGLSEI